MKITLNGQEKELGSNSNLFDLIQELSPKNQRVIAEVNGEIIRNPSWNDIQIKDGDTIELVRFVAGG